jgi:hypothetical protein
VRETSSSGEPAPKRADGRLRMWAAAAGAVLRRPSLWGTAVREVRVLAPPGWWRTPPFLPVPDRAYLRFRLETAYGDQRHGPEARDVVTYLRWCRAWPHVVSGSHLAD